MIGILTSLPIEAGCLTSKRLRVGQTIALNEKVLLHISGIGASRAKIGAYNLVTQGVTSLISWGTAGGLAKDLQAGQLIIPKKIVDQNNHSFITDTELRNHFHEILHHRITICNETLLQSNEVITSVGEKQALFSELQAVAVDMESAAVAAVAQQSSIPFIAMRSIVDSAMMSLPDWLPKTFNADNEVQPLKFTWQLCTHPHSVFSLIHIAQCFSRAKHTLTTAAKLIGWRS